MNALTLKIIAVLTMVVDHAGFVLFSGVYENFETYSLMRSIGRIAFPIFAYLIAQGCVHTKDIGKYLLRLGVLAIVSEVFFDIALVGEINFLADTNIFYTLFLAVAAIAVYQTVGKISLFAGIAGGVAAALAAIFAAHALDVDYGVFGVIFILALYIAGPLNRRSAAIIITLSMVYFYMPNLQLTLFALIAAVFVYFYNGKPGYQHFLLKYAFYFFYPIHLAVLSLF